METIIQIIIFSTEGVAMYLSQQSNKTLHKYAPIIGIIGEPFWIYDSVVKQSHGILGLSIIYTFIWMVGLRTHWFSSDKKMMTYMNSEYYRILVDSAKEEFCFQFDGEDIDKARFEFAALAIEAAEKLCPTKN